MMTKKPFLWAVVLLFPAWAPLWAANPQFHKAKGHVLVLENERVLEGDIEHVGDQYRVRRTVGETWVPGEQVLCLCDNLAEAHAFLRTRTNLRDADERLRLARWCQLHGLRSQALEEVKAALALNPNHAEAQRWLRSLERSAALAPAAPASHSGEKPEPETGPVSAIDLSAPSLGVFTSRVQPILMNTCASCHATGRGGAFKLVRVYDDDLSNHRATQQNMTAVLAQINRDHVAASPLLMRAVSVHGEAEQPPLKSRQTAAYHILEDWVKMAMVDANPEGNPSPTPALFSSEPRPAAEPMGTGNSGAAPGGGKPAAQADGSPAASPMDPFDPGIFNRQMHPGS
ncbi:MAG: hypothetical protein JO112_08350 [Planctomycetes bacterium]|nr:hypothetical protein [Planctomycetota bacterium]